MLDKLRDKIINYVYIVSKHPVLYKDLLRANMLFNDGLYVDPALLNFRKNLKKAYISYALICLCLLLPLLLLTHTLFTKIDFHISIVGTIVATSAVFIGFNFYTVWLRVAITRKLIKKAWELHFPYFSYEKYSQKVELLYEQALKEEIPKARLEEFIFNRLAK